MLKNEELYIFIGTLLRCEPANNCSNKQVIIWSRVRGRIYMGCVFIVRTFDFGQIHVREELEFIPALACTGTQAARLS